MIHVLVTIVVTCIVCGLLIWVLDQFPLADPFGRIARIAIIVIGVLVVVFALLRLVGYSPGLGYGPL